MLAASEELLAILTCHVHLPVENNIEKDKKRGKKKTCELFTCSKMQSKIILISCKLMLEGPSLIHMSKKGLLRLFKCEVNKSSFMDLLRDS